MAIEKYVELKLGNNWTDITSSVRGSGKITMVHGKSNEQSGMQPARCTLQINNANGDWSDVNQNSPNFGLIGPYTEMRVLTQRIIDTFTRTVANGMGTGDSGQTYTLNGTTANFDITGSAFTLVTSTTSQSASTGLFGDVHISAQMSTSADTLMGLTKRMANGDRIIAYIDTAADRVRVNRVSDTVSLPFVTSLSDYAGMTFSTGTSYTMILAISEQVKVKVWPTSQGEPDDWHISFWVDMTSTSTAQQTPKNLEAQRGEVGMFGQANSGSQTITFDNFSAREIRFHGEIPAWPPVWDTTGKDAYVNIEANGLTRRLNTRTSPIASPMTRSITGSVLKPLTTCHWALEETQPSATYRNTIEGGPDLITLGFMRPASISTIPGSDPIMQAYYPVMSGFRGLINNTIVDTTGNINFHCLYSVPEAGLPIVSDIVTLWVSGTTANRWIIRYTNSSGGMLQLLAYDSSNVLIDSGAQIAFGGVGVNGRTFALKMSLITNGTNITYGQLGVTFLNENNDYQAYSVTNTSMTLAPGQASTIQVLTDADGGIGQICIGTWNADDLSVIIEPHLQGLPSPYDSGLAAYQGESTAGRFVRLCREEGVWGQVSVDYDLLSPTSNRMGPQPRNNFISLQQDVETAEHGLLYELRDALGYGLRTAYSLWNRLPVVTYSYTANPYSGSILPTNDDQFFKNAVTVARPSGERSQIVRLNQGRKRVSAIGMVQGDQTINFYPATNDVNHATYSLRFLAWDEQRVPNLKMELHRAPYVNSSTLFTSTVLLGIGRNLMMTNNPVWLRGNLAELVVGYTEVIWNLTREITFNTVPYGPYKVAVFMGSDTSTGFRIGWADAKLNGSHNASTTSLSVEKTNGILFETGADANFPYYIQVDDEVMKVNSITGGSSPQTFTVDRGQRNTVAKTHADDAAVLPYDFPVIGLAKRLR